MKLLNLLKVQRSASDEEVYRELIRREAKIGGEVLGPVHPGGRREFFYLDDNTWIWHEEWIDAADQRRIITTRYDIRPNGVLKAQDGQNYRYIDLAEARNLYQAIKLYLQRVSSEVYGNPIRL